MQEKEIRQTTIAYYVANILSAHFAMTFGVYVLMLKHSGLNLTEINAINFTFMIAVFFLEVPTGSFADIFGHKKSFIIGLMIEGIGLILYFLASSFWGYILAEIIVAFASAMQSGSLDAWAVNRLRKLGWRNGYAGFFGRSYVYHRVAILVMAWIGAKIGYRFGLSWPFLVAGILAMLSSAVLWFVLNNGDHSEETKAGIRSWRDFYRNISQGRQIIVNHERLALLFGICFIISMMVQPVNMQWSVLYEARFNTVDTSTPVFVQVLGTIIGASLLAFFCTKVRGMITQLTCVIIVIGMTIFIIPATNDWGIFMAVLFVHELPRGMVMPLQASWVNEFVQDDCRRATVNSYFGMLWTLAAGTGLLLSGFWAEWWGIAFTWQTISLISMILLAALLAIYHWKQKSSVKRIA